MNNNLDWWTGSGTRVNGPLVNIYGNANATWEKSKKLNLGVDMTLLESMDITIDYFKEDRSGIFYATFVRPFNNGSDRYAALCQHWLGKE